MIMVCGSGEQRAPGTSSASRGPTACWCSSTPAQPARRSRTPARARQLGDRRCADPTCVGFGVQRGHRARMTAWIERARAGAASSPSRPARRTMPTSQRMARRLAGRSLGVVLSGGGARAFAHLGVLEVLLDAGMRVDRVGGRQHGRVHRRAARRRARQRRDRRLLLRGVGEAQPDQRLHDPAATG